MRRYKKELKETILALYSSGRDVKELSQEYDIPSSTIRTWVRLHEEVNRSMVVNKAGLSKEELGIKRLKKELADVAGQITIYLPKFPFEISKT